MKAYIGPYRKNRKIQIRIDKPDTWSMDHTLALIIQPMLIQLKNTQHGSPYVDNEDVPENLRSTSAPPNKEEWDLPALFHERWQHVLDEMIWAFSQHVDDSSEDQFYSGTADISWEKDSEFGGEELFKMVEGPGHTFEVDEDGLKAFNDRKQNGFRLFGKYYTGLWD